MPPQQPNNPDQTSQYQPDNSSSKPSQPSRRTKALLAGLVTLVLLAAALWLFASSREETRDLAQDSGMVISVTNEGFSPATVLITPGTTVTWINDSDDPAHIASNPHPEHDGLPGLDSGEPIFIGQSYSFTFKEPGTYGYHDHLNPEINGTVEVAESEEGNE